MKPNLKLFTQVKAAILAEPKQFRMDAFFVSGRNIPNCGTAACIAGWAIALSQNRNPRSARRHLVGWEHTLAENILGIYTEGDRLFYIQDWPQRFQDAWAGARNPLARAKVAVRRINYFLKHGK